MNTDKETFEVFFSMRSAIWSKGELYNAMEKQYINAKKLHCLPLAPLTELHRETQTVTPLGITKAGFAQWSSAEDIQLILETSRSPSASVSLQ